MPDASSVDRPGFVAEAAARIRSRWRLKLGLTLGVNALFWGPYWYLGHHAWRTPRTLDWSWLDRAAGFQPQPWAWIYLSVFVLTGLGPWLIVGRRDLLRYGKGFLLLAGASFLVFLLWPVAAPRPADWAGHAVELLWVRWDGPFNAFPSLHAGTLVYTLALLARLFRGRRGFSWVFTALVVWAGLVLWATLALKQHYAVDLLAGAVLGWVADRWAWRSADASLITAMAAR
jgi:membrane-associated phospholipid phosphatase